MIRKISLTVVSLGVLIALFFLITNMIEGGFQPARIAGIEIGVVIILSGAVLFVFQHHLQRISAPFWPTLHDRVYALPVFFWIALGFLINYFLFYIFPTFLNADLRIEYPQKYLPAIFPIGADLRATLMAAKVSFAQGQIVARPYPPLVNFLTAPLMLLSSTKAYALVTVATLVSFALSILLAILLGKAEQHASILFVGALNLFSYGLVFELERGQFYTIAMMLSLAAIYIFYRHPSYRFFAYILFCISVQLKFFSALFFVLFVDDWRDWKSNLKRFFGLGLANFLLLFLEGFSYFNAFFFSLVTKSDSQEMWIGNHSIQSFVALLHVSGMGNNNIVIGVLYVYVLICLAVVLVHTYLKNQSGFNADLLLVCTIGALVLPPISHDYTLPMLMAPLALFISNQGRRGIIPILLVFIVSLAYSATLFPNKYRPDFLNNNFPLLMAILTATTLLNILKGRQSEAHE